MQNPVLGQGAFLTLANIGQHPPLPVEHGQFHQIGIQGQLQQQGLELVIVFADQQAAGGQRRAAGQAAALLHRFLDQLIALHAQIPGRGHQQRQQQQQRAGQDQLPM